jgi:hypothetical protein
MIMARMAVARAMIVSMRLHMLVRAVILLCLGHGRTLWCCLKQT